VKTFDVIITCSGLGSRLAPITNYLNKALIKLGDKAIISYILESYPSNTRFIITLGYLKDQVRNYIEINHSDLNIEFVEVGDYESTQSSLLYSLSCTFDLIDKPFFYNACDTFVSKPIYFDSNFALVSKTFIGNQYRMFDSTIKDEPAKEGELCYTGLAYVKDFDEFKKIALEILKQKTHNLSDAHVLQQMKINFIETENWIDIGNFIALSNAEQKFNSEICVLSKKNEMTYYVNNKIVKYFSDKNKVDALFERSKELSDCVPSCNQKGNFIYYNFIKGITLSKVLNENILDNFLSWCNENLWKKTNKFDDDFFKNFYINKAIMRVESFEKERKNVISSVKNINFRAVDNLFNLIEQAEKKFKINTEMFRCHGDLVFENVIKTNDGFLLIDWREGFLTNLGDKLYDIAKMKHNLIFDHEAIKEKKFYVKIENDQCFFDAGTPKKNIQLINTLENWCLSNGIDIKIINLIVSLIQLSSSGVHTGDEATLLYCMGWYNLNKIINHEQHA